MVSPPLPVRGVFYRVESFSLAISDVLGYWQHEVMRILVRLVPPAVDNTAEEVTKVVESNGEAVPHSLRFFWVIIFQN
jgi:hypothetical protein